MSLFTLEDLQFWAYQQTEHCKEPQEVLSRLGFKEPSVMNALQEYQAWWTLVNNARFSIELKQDDDVKQWLVALFQRFGIFLQQLQKIIFTVYAPYAARIQHIIDENQHVHAMTLALLNGQQQVPGVPVFQLQLLNVSEEHRQACANLVDLVNLVKQLDNVPNGNATYQRLQTIQDLLLNTAREWSAIEETKDIRSFWQVHKLYKDRLVEIVAALKPVGSFLNLKPASLALLNDATNHELHEAQWFESYEARKL
jgi:hypothetical protein